MQTISALLFLIMMFTGILILLGFGINSRLGTIIKQNRKYGNKDIEA